MACTLVTAELRGFEARVYHVGDSRAWVIRGGRALRLTRDHTVGESMGRGGETLPPGADNTDSICDALDGYFVASPFEEVPHHDLCELTVTVGDILLLASDGILMLDELTIGASTQMPLAEMTRALFDAAVGAGSDDNISILALSFARG